MNWGIISRRYARTLFLFGKKRGTLKELYAESLVLGERLRQLPKLRDIVRNKMVDPDKKLKLLVESSGGDITNEFKEYLALIIKQKREEFLQTVLLSFQEMVREEFRWVDVDLTTAIEIDESLKERITNELSHEIDATVTLRPHIDPSLIGGYIVQWDTYRLDASVKGKLKRIRQELTAN